MVLLLAALPGCATSTCKDTINLDGVPTSAIITVKKDCVVTIKLEALLGTGLRWQVKSVDPEHASLISRPYGRFLSSGDIGGAQGQEITFRTLKPGTSDIVLEYLRFGREVLKVKHLKLVVI